MLKYMVRVPFGSSETRHLKISPRYPLSQAMSPWLLTLPYTQATNPLLTLSFFCFADMRAFSRLDLTPSPACPSPVPLLTLDRRRPFLPSSLSTCRQ